MAKLPVRKKNATPRLLLVLRYLMVYTYCSYFSVFKLGWFTLRQSWRGTRVVIIQTSCSCVLIHFVKSPTMNFVEDLGSSSAQGMSQTQMASGKVGKAMLSWQEGSPPCFRLTQSCSKAKLELWIPLQYIHTQRKRVCCRAQIATNKSSLGLWAESQLSCSHLGRV